MMNWRRVGLDLDLLAACGSSLVVAFRGGNRRIRGWGCQKKRACRMKVEG
jgi:hypothetical protein